MNSKLLWNSRAYFFYPHFLLNCALFLLVFLSGMGSISAQQLDRRFKIRINEVGLTFKMPPGYLPLDSGQNFPCGDGQAATLKLYSIANKDTSVIICFGIVTYPSERIIENTKKRWNPDYDPDKNHLVTAKNLADTINHKLVFYDKKLLKSRFNADDGGEYTRNCTLPYLGKYNNHRVVFFTKKKRGHVELTYFYTDRIQQNIEKVISKTAGMLKYNE